MKRVLATGEVVFRPSITRASLPLAGSAVMLPVLTGLLVRGGVLEWWTLGTALAGSVLVFGVSFVMPFLCTFHVKPGEISGPSGYGINTLRLDRLDHGRTRLHASGEVELVDDLGSRLHLSRAYLTGEEILDALRIFGVDPQSIARVDAAF